MTFLHGGSVSVQPADRNAVAGLGREGQTVWIYWPTACGRSRRGLPIGRASPHSGQRRCTTWDVRSTTTWSASPHTRQSGNTRRSGALRSGFGRMVTTSFMSLLKCTTRAARCVDSIAMPIESHEFRRSRTRQLGIETLREKLRDRRFTRVARETRRAPLADNESEDVTQKQLVN